MAEQRQSDDADPAFECLVDQGVLVRVADWDDRVQSGGDPGYFESARADRVDECVAALSIELPAPTDVPVVAPEWIRSARIS